MASYKSIKNLVNHNFIIFDLEATCWEGDKSKRSEIIEIGAVKISNGKIIDEFQSFIRPQINPVLSDFCKNLTSIKQEEVNRAKFFHDVLSEFRDWIGNNYLLCSWGFYDRKQFTSDCSLHKCSTNWLTNHISLKHQHEIFMHLHKGVGVPAALRMAGMQFEGIHHRGIDDAKNIAKIFLYYMDKWKYWE